ncbi:MAG: sensor histidine kinase [Chloroflexota bacterium]
MSELKTTDTQRDVWERTGWIWTAVFHLNLFVILIIGLSDPDNAAMRLPILAWGVGLAMWQIGLLYGLSRWGWYKRPYLTTLLVGLGVFFWFQLVHINPFFYFLLGGLFPFVYIFLPIRWAIFMTLIINSLAAYDNYLRSGRPTHWFDTGWLYWLAYSAMAILLGIWIYAIIRQSTQRRELIEQLQATQAELAAAERREGMLQERERLAREIHDTLAQGFTSIVMHLEAAEQAMETNPQRLRHHLDKARDTARHSLEQARHVVQDLRPDLLAQHALPDAIGRAAARWSEESGIAVTAVTTGDILPLHPDLDVTLLRAVQEALANVRKHAQAQHVAITLSYMGDMVALDVQDDGVGLAGAAPSPFAGGYGLTAMRQRVAQFGGTVELESEPGAGTTVAVAIPVSQEP